MESDHQIICLPWCGNEESSGCRAFDFVLDKPCTNFNSIQFSNQQSYSISVLCQFIGCSDWKIILWDYVLMPCPHSVGRCSENSVTLLNDDINLENLTLLRVILRQPSPHWDNFGISNFSLVCSCVGDQENTRSYENY